MFFRLCFHSLCWRFQIRIPRDEGDAESDGGRVQALIKERWRHVNVGLDNLIDQQRGWSVPDPGLRANLQEVIVEDIVSVYRDFWKRYEV